MTNPIITKEHFVACIETLREADDMARRINNIVEEYGRGDFIDGYAFSDTDTETKLMETLEIALGDNLHLISWFCIETDYGRGHSLPYDEPIIRYDGEDYEFHTAAELYDFLIEHQN